MKVLIRMFSEHALRVHDCNENYVILCSRHRYVHSVTVLLHVCVCVLVVEECKRRLLAVGFEELREKESWKVNPLGKV